MENLTEIIAEDYKKWKTRDQIWISAPTGIGKTFFIDLIDAKPFISPHKCL